MDRGGSEVVSVLAFYSNDSSLNPNTVYSFMCTFFEKNENKQKEAGDGPFKTLLASEGGVVIVAWMAYLVLGYLP